MKKKNAKKEKTIYRKAGEAIGTLGHEIVEGTEKLVEATQNIAGKVSDLISSKKKKVAKKKSAIKQAVKKTVKKVAKKAVSVKKKSPAKKKVAKKKTVKKSTAR